MVHGEAAERFLAGPLMAEVDPESRRAVLAALAEDRAPAGAVLLAQGKRNERLSFLIGGSAVVERARPGGPVETLAALAAPTAFGTTTFFGAGVPTFGVRASSDVWLLTLDRPAHERLRRDDPRAAEALALAAVRILSERFNDLTRSFTDYMDRHPDDPAKVNEWAGFRARLFDELAD